MTTDPLTTSQLGLGLRGHGMNTQCGLLELLPFVFENDKTTNLRVQVDLNKGYI